MINTNERDEREKSTDSMQGSPSSQGWKTQEKKSTTGSDDTRSREPEAELGLESSDRRPTRQMTGGPDKPTA